MTAPNPLSGTHATSQPPSARRAGWGILLVLSALWLGFGAGMFTAGRFFVPEGSGLAGPAIAFSYGLGAAVIAGIAASLAAWKASIPTVRTAALIAMVLGFLLTALLAVGVVMKAGAGS